MVDVRKILTIFSLIGLLLSVGLWGASYFNFRVWWGENSVLLGTGRLYWNQGMPSSTPLAWRCEGFHSFYLKGLKPSPLKQWGFRRAPPTHRMSYGEIPPNVALPGITVSWYRFYANGVMSWTYRTEILLWLPVLLFGVWPAWRLLPFPRRRKRKRHGLCLQCGYDLRGSKERCPECGTGFSS